MVRSFALGFRVLPLYRPVKHYHISQGTYHSRNPRFHTGKLLKNSRVLARFPNLCSLEKMVFYYDLEIRKYLGPCLNWVPRKVDESDFQLHTIPKMKGISTLAYNSCKSKAKLLLIDLSIVLVGSQEFLMSFWMTCITKMWSGHKPLLGIYACLPYTVLSWHEDLDSWGFNVTLAGQKI